MYISKINFKEIILIKPQKIYKFDQLNILEFETFIICNYKLIFLRVAMLRKTGESLGIEMYNQPKVFPSTLKAHTLLEFAGTKNNGEKQNDVAERLFKVSHVTFLKLSLYKPL